MTAETPKWSYPLYLIRIGTGFASVVSDDAEKSICSVVVFTSMDRMERFLDKAQLTGEPRELSNDREFAYFAQGLKPPISHVAFDSNPEGKQVNPRWSVEIPTLLRDHLPHSASPWDYPVYAITERKGYSCIQGQSSGQETIQAICLFTEYARAADYQTCANLHGDITTLETPSELRKLLEQLKDDASAVAIDPTADGESRQAKVCVSVETVIQRYLPSTGDEN